jgi:hypothetical protein
VRFSCHPTNPSKLRAELPIPIACARRHLAEPCPALASGSIPDAAAVVRVMLDPMVLRKSEHARAKA